MLKTPAQRLLDVLGCPTRRIIFNRLRKRPQAVGELAKGLSVSRPAVSQHLAILARAGLVSAEPDGWKRIYRAEPEGLKPLRAWLDEIGA